MIKHRTVYSLSLALLLTLGLASCTEDTPKGGSDENGTEGLPEASTEQAPFRMTESAPPELNEANPDLAENTNPSRTSTGLPEIYGVRSGRLMQRYEGERSGTRETLFKDYGYLERIADSMQPKNPRDAAPFKITRYNAPTFMIQYDHYVRHGWKAPRDMSHYTNSEQADSMYYADFVFKKGYNAKQLPDTVINGYKTAVYRNETPAFVHTVWVWRGLILREHFFATVDNVEYRIEPVSLETDINIADSEFAPPKDYVIVERQAPPVPSALPPPSLEEIEEQIQAPKETSGEFPIGK